MLAGAAVEPVPVVQPWGRVVNPKAACKADHLVLVLGAIISCEGDGGCWQSPLLFLCLSFGLREAVDALGKWKPFPSAKDGGPTCIPSCSCLREGLQRHKVLESEMSLEQDEEQWLL